MAKKLSNAGACINGPAPAIAAQDERVWSEAGWLAFIEDVDMHIERRRADIKKLRRSRRIAQRNLDAFKPYPRHLQKAAEAELVRMAEDYAARLKELRKSGSVAK